MGSKKKDKDENSTPAPVKTVKKEREGKTGHLGSRKNPQDPTDLIIQGRGRFAKFKPTRGGGYQGGASASFGSFDYDQAVRNKEAGLIQ